MSTVSRTAGMAASARARQVAAQSGGGGRSAPLAS